MLEDISHDLSECTPTIPISEEDGSEVIAWACVCGRRFTLEEVRQQNALLEK
jgi:hypothetical protein